MRNCSLSLNHVRRVCAVGQECYKNSGFLPFVNHSINTIIFHDEPSLEQTKVSAISSSNLQTLWHLRSSSDWRVSDHRIRTISRPSGTNVLQFSLSLLARVHRGKYLTNIITIWKWTFPTLPRFFFANIFSRLSDKWILSEISAFFRQYFTHKLS